ncbi:MAG: DJ-1/PfpI family protein, partial [Hadesarchaea archaeon]|nr:DJ-1/PfpI family protein [Hadesarchaea archaeon]
KLVAAICGAPSVLAEAGVLEGRKATIYPGMEGELRKGGGRPSRGLVVVDGKVVTSMGPATAFAFALKLLELLAGKKKAEEVKKATLAHLGAKLR